MDTSTEEAVHQLDDVIRTFEEISKKTGVEHAARLVTRMRAAITRLTGPTSVYRKQAETTNQYELLGIVKGLRDDLAAGFMRDFREIVNADLYSDFLSMAEYLLQNDKLKQPAAVIAGGV